ncbi:hypothetical protein ACHY48_16150 [Pantoea agglomerans]|uniref:hypothetical protein n=1 Tax=Enterobacter agglomerans TaxID=549 RepID=UPI00387EFE4A
MSQQNVNTTASESKESSFFNGQDFSLCFLLLSVLLPCCSWFSGFLSLKINGMNSLMAPSGSPALPGRQPHCANRLCR